MKHFLVFLVSLFCATLSAQTTAPAQEQTKLQSFIAKKGSMIVKDFRKVGVIDGIYGGSMTFEAVSVYAPGNESAKMKGLKITVASTKDDESALLDVDEVDALNKALSYLTDLSSKWTTENKEYVETIFSTKDEFQLGFYQQDQKQTAFAKAGRIRATSCFFSSVAEFGKMKELTDKALLMIKSM